MLHTEKNDPKWAAPVSPIAQKREILPQTGTPFRTQNALLIAGGPQQGAVPEQAQQEALVCFISKISRF